jgi:5-methylcytosine-specific restriction protein A
MADLRYAGLGAYLQHQDVELLRLTFDEIEALIAPYALPAEARKRQFWANTGAHHATRREQWLGAGYRAFLESADGRVRFERASGAESLWSQAELGACVMAYRELWLAQEAGVPMAKAALRRKVVASSLNGRSEAAYERRMQNISAVIDELGMQFVRGYVPLRNIGGAKPTIIALVNSAWQRADVAEKPTSDPDKLATRVASARDKLTKAGLADPPPGSAAPPQKARSVLRFVRDAEVVAWVLEAAGGVCEVCNDPAPFADMTGAPFLEVHHVRWLSHGGPDTCDNAVAACPNCHRALHLSQDRDALRRRVVRKVARLIDHPRTGVSCGV